MILRHATAALCLVLAACNQQPEDAGTTAAGGEVLPGSISDAMIDLDTSTASPPLAPVRVTTPKKADSPAASEAREPAEPAAASADTE